MSNNSFEVIIIGGSYAGLSAAMSLGRSIRKVLIIDSGKPCNEQTPFSHNLLTHDGEKPADIARKAKEQVMQYPTITFMKGKVVNAERVDQSFKIETEEGAIFKAHKLLFTTGVFDQIPDIKGFSECWGISIVHCPYCHGYEVRNAATAVFVNGDDAYHVCMLLTNWTKEITLITNGPSTLTEEQLGRIRKHNIEIIEKEVMAFDQTDGQIKQILFKDGSGHPTSVMYAKIPFIQHSDLPEKLGCRFTEHGYIFIDEAQRTTIPGVYAAGDNVTMRRILSGAIGTGTLAGISINLDLIMENL
jgi:thioredoxin reductase